MGRSRLQSVLLTVALALGMASVASPGSGSGSASGPEPAAGSHRAERSTEISLKSRTFDPAPGLQRAAIVGRRAPGEPVHFIAQFQPVPRAEDRAAFARAGIRLLAPLNGGAYLARSTGARLRALESLPGFRWAGPLRAEDKIDPAVRGGRAPAYAVADDGRVALTVQVHADLTADDAVRVARAHGGEVVGTTPLVPSVTALFPAGSVAAIAASDAVSYVAAMDAPLQEHNDGAIGALNAAPTYAAPYNLNGAGTTVLVYDSGIAQHSDYDGRITQTDGDSAVPTRRHSTHVAGTVLGDGANSTGSDTKGNANNGTANQWAGLATAANLATFGSVGSTAGDTLYDNPGDMNADFTTAIGGGIDIATMSLGNNTGSNGFPCAQLGDYTNTSILIDQIVTGSISGQELIWFESAGNERNQACAGTTGYSTISSPAPAKNSIVVGAINSNDNSMTNFSSWGPTDDGRLRPDLTGPGCQSTGDGNIWSTAFEAAGNAAVLEAGEAVNSYTGMCGTSMATPALAGVGSLLVQQWRTTYGAGTRPLPHSMKALLAQTAADLGNPGPDYAFGYGQPDAQAAVDLVRAGNLIQVDQVDQGDTDTWYFSSDGSTAPRVTIAWSDPEAARNSTTQLINDVDLVVTQPDGTVRRPQVLDPANPANNSAEGDDDLNVMEMVLGTADAGNWKVEVRGSTIADGPARYSLVTPAAATTNVPPVADAGGPYSTAEGQSVALDGTGSSDPEGGALTYAWDLDNNGTFETSGATPTFPAQGQDGVYTVVLRVTDPQGSSATDTATVTVANVVPTVTVNAIAPISEHGTTTVSGTVTDPGWLDTHTATVDFDDGAGPVALTLTAVPTTPPAAASYTFSVVKQYGDNGAFTVAVVAYDDDGSGSGTATATVANLNPTATIAAGGQQVYDGKSAFVAQKGETVTVPASSTDAGSDDLRFSWAWGDGASTVLDSLVNPPATDPAKSPSVQPRDVTLSADHAYSDACLYNLGLGVRDDDGGTASASAVVLITGNADTSRGHGWWLNQYRPKGSEFTPAELQCYLDIANYFSKVFSEHTAAATRGQATKVLNAPAKAPEAVIFDQFALAAWLNFANGSVTLGTLLDTDGDRVRDTTFGSVMLTAETVRVDPASTSAQIKAQKDILDRIVTQSRP